MTNKLYELTTRQFDWLEQRLRSTKLSNKTMIVGSASCLVLAVVVLVSDPTYATSIEERIGTVGELFKGTGAKAGLTVATVVGTVFAGVKHSVGAALSVFGCGIGLSYYLGWLWSDNFGK
jgi:hypothetical protein